MPNIAALSGIIRGRAKATFCRRSDMGVNVIYYQKIIKKYLLKLLTK
jgi:hypothetical protein